MMDGQVLAIRDALDEEQLEQVPSAPCGKYASALYGPVREAVEVEIAGGGDPARKGPADVRESLRRSGPTSARAPTWSGQAGADLSGRAGARPGRGGRPTGGVPRLGGDAMVHAAAERGWIDGTPWPSSRWRFTRAGVAVVLTYFARRLAQGMQ